MKRDQMLEIAKGFVHPHMLKDPGSWRTTFKESFVVDSGIRTLAVECFDEAIKELGSECEDGTHTIKITFLCDVELSADELHEQLCKCIHEGQQFPSNVAFHIMNIE